MTKEQIKEHGDVIKWFCDHSDMGVWRKDYWTDSWFFCRQPEFSTGYVYIQNDGYAELRKADVDGKTIQWKNTTTNEWVDYKSSDSKLYTLGLQHYRIKPEEPEFKVGDWVYAKYTSGCEPTLSQVREVRGRLVVNIPNTYGTVVGVRIDKVVDLHLWRPTKGCWCVFWDNNTERCRPYYTIAEFWESNTYKFIDIELVEWDNIAPIEFAQTLEGE